MPVGCSVQESGSGGVQEGVQGCPEPVQGAVQAPEPHLNTLAPCVRFGAGSAGSAVPLV